MQPKLTYREFCESHPDLPAPGIWFDANGRSRLGYYWDYEREWQAEFVANRPEVVGARLREVLVKQRHLIEVWDFPAVYLVKKPDSTVLYVGFSMNPGQRLRQHLGTSRGQTLLGKYVQAFRPKSLNWPVEIYPVANKKAGYRKEAKMIDELQPEFNLACAL